MHKMFSTVQHSVLFVTRAASAALVSVAETVGHPNTNPSSGAFIVYSYTWCQIPLHDCTLTEY